jgi:hypothetical protein
MKNVKVVMAGLMIAFFFGFNAQGQDKNLDLIMAIEEGNEAKVKALLAMGGTPKTSLVLVKPLYTKRSYPTR